MSMLNESSPKKTTIKCIVWDLDNTIWNGTLLEDQNITIISEIVEVIKLLDERGVLHSIASKNEFDMAIAKLQEFGLANYFLYPQIGWQPKSDSIKAIAASTNIGLDAIAFVDDQPFEREEITFSFPEVRCFDAKDAILFPDMPEMTPKNITDDSRKRRRMYLSEIDRTNAEKQFAGTSEEFLAGLQMIVTLSRAQENDLARAEELTVRTHQLNTTGYTYSYDELNRFRTSDKHLLLIAGLDDKFGTYGKIGLALLECQRETWTIKLLLMSCRVLSRGIGTIMINYLLKLAKDAGVMLRAEFIPNGRNRMMYITYSFAGFKEISINGKQSILENDLTFIQPIPNYIILRTENNSSQTQS